jgi:hypothetical protein
MLQAIWSKAQTIEISCPSCAAADDLKVRSLSAGSSFLDDRTTLSSLKCANHRAFGEQAHLAPAKRFLVFV